MTKNLLGVDVGEARIGLAIAGSVAKLPRPYKILPNSPAIFDQIASIIKSERIGTVVVGLPRNMSGQETAQTLAIRQFAVRLEGKIATSVAFADESLSTKRAEDLTKELKGRPASADLDDLAACFILEEFIKAHS